jgi:ATP-dependent RNA helicase RhlE
MLFSELGLSAELLRATEKQGYKEATPVQQQAIPLILEGNDLLAGAQTGTGKTAGFTLPLLQRMQQSEHTEHSGRKHFIRALILVPTRELAAQVAESVRIYGTYLPFKSTVIFGGVSINPQITQLRRGVDIVIATPGRLLDHMQRGTIRLDGVETLVLDEADRMLDMGFVNDIRKVMKALPADRQNLLFSATFSKEISQLANDLLNSPMEIQIARRNTTAEQISQAVHHVDKSRKRELLSHMIGEGNWRQVLVFTRTKHMANRLTTQLERDGLSAAAIHGNKSQGARTRALADFKKGKTRVLVATDIAARGLDIELLPHVVNYELPNVPEDYIHRIGRTGRAGQEGQAVSLVCIDENKLLAEIERLLKQKIEVIAIPGYEPDQSIKAVPIKNGGGNRGSSRGQRSGGRSNNRSNGRGNGRPGANARAHNGSREGQRRRSRRAA